MMYSLVIPVYNRPEELDELLESVVSQSYSEPFEVVVIEDGSSLTSSDVVDKYANTLSIKYLLKTNTGPGDSRNYGMQRASGDYFIIFDSDCVLPKEYLKVVDEQLSKEFVDCFGGPDAAHESFSDTQKAIDFSMTSVLTTGGVRGKKTTLFQPRSFNMGLSKKAFEQTKGFGMIHPGEDPELVFRLWDLGFKTKLFKEAFVYHKRRIDFEKFYVQVNKFGKVRPIIESWHPEYTKVVFVFPALFITLLDVAIIGWIFGYDLGIKLYAVYFSIVFLSALIHLKGIKKASLAFVAVLIQFYGYGLGYLKSSIMISVLKKNPQEIFPELFFKK